MERIPAARCNQANQASRRTLQRAGMFPCARIIRGRIPDDLSKERDV
jgi:RimJ/RimL family protein N-acetyltransferase